MGDQESYTVSFVSYWKQKPSSQKSVQKIQKFDETTFTHNAPNGFFCWLGHLKMSFYYPSSHRGQGDSILLVL